MIIANNEISLSYNIHSHNKVIVSNVTTKCLYILENNVIRQIKTYLINQGLDYSTNTLYKTFLDRKSVV